VRTEFNIETPHIVAGIDGTEALAGVDGDVELVAVREGLVSAYDRDLGLASELAVPAGDAAYRSNAVRFNSVDASSRSLQRTVVESVPAIQSRQSSMSSKTPSRCERVVDSTRH
jgi:hypothetical protein